MGTLVGLAGTAALIVATNGNTEWWGPAMYAVVWLWRAVSVLRLL
jgi:hypothetical protein